MNQSFDSKELKKFCKQEEFIEFGLTKSDLEKQINEVFEKITEETFEFSINRTGSYFLTESLFDKLVLRKLNDNIKRIYKDEQANRKIIISQIKVLLQEDCPYWIIKTDIKSFYESINREFILEKFKNDSILSYFSVFLLNQLFSNKEIVSTYGLPRGMNISATMSEIYMRKFDKWIKNCSGVYYYARFVDDIIIFTNTLKNAQLVLESIGKNLDELSNGLKINSNKTQLYNGLSLERLSLDDFQKYHENHPLEYLGYKFSKTKVKNKYTLTVGIAEKKLKKIKTRIVYSFLDFTKNTNIVLLENRIKFLTGNYSIKKSSEGNDLRSGIFFNYSQITDFKQLESLNTFYRKILYSKKGNLGLQINCISKTQKKRLSKYCFISGFKKKVYSGFNYTEISEIVKCW